MRAYSMEERLDRLVDFTDASHLPPSAYEESCRTGGVTKLSASLHPSKPAKDAAIDPCERPA